MPRDFTLDLDFKCLWIEWRGEWHELADTTNSGRGMWFCSPVDLWTSIHLRLGINSRQLIMIIQISLEICTQKTNQVNRVRKQEQKNEIVFLQMKKDVFKYLHYHLKRLYLLLIFRNYRIKGKVPRRNKELCRPLSPWDLEELFFVVTRRIRINLQWLHTLSSAWQWTVGREEEEPESLVGSKKKAEGRVKVIKNVLIKKSAR